MALESRLEDGQPVSQIVLPYSGPASITNYSREITLISEQNFAVSPFFVKTSEDTSSSLLSHESKKYRMNSSELRHICFSLDYSTPWATQVVNSLSKKVLVNPANNITNLITPEQNEKARQVYRNEDFSLFKEESLDISIIKSNQKFNILNRGESGNSSCKPLYRNGEFCEEYIGITREEDFIISFRNKTYEFNHKKQEVSCIEDAHKKERQEKRKHRKEIIKEMLKDNPPAKVAMISAPIATVLPIAILYNSPNLSDYMLLSQGINTAMLIASGNLIDLAFSPKWAKSNEDFPIYGKIRDLADKMNVKCRIGVYHGKKEQAFAYISIIPYRKNIVFADSLVSKLNEEEMLSVAGHELGHLKKGHVFAMYGLSAALVPISAFGLWQLLKECSIGAWIGIGFLGGGIKNAFSLLLRKFEYNADECSARNTSGKDLISALRKITPKYRVSLDHPSTDKRESNLMKKGLI